MGSRVRRRLAGTALPLLALLPLLFALDRAVNYDDVLFLRAAAQIRLTPTRPYAATMNWYGWSEPLWQITKNPPGVSFWLAAVQALGGSSERAWHLALLPFAAAGVLGGTRLARRFAPGSVWVTAAWVASPALLVSASTLMVDVPALAFMLWGVALWVEGVDGDRRIVRLSGALLTGIGVVVKYSAAVSVPVLALYPILCAPVRRRRALLADLWPVTLASAGWTVLNLVTDGRSHLVDSLTVGGGALAPVSGLLPQRQVAIVTFVALSAVFPALFVVVALRRRRGWILLGLAALLGIAAGRVTVGLWPHRDAGVPAVVAVAAALGVCALLVVTEDAGEAAVRGGEGETVFLVSWVGLQAVFAVLWSWTVAVRFVLPLLPPLALLLWRALLGAGGDGAAADRRRARADRLLGASAVAALVVSVLLLKADAAPGNYHRVALPQIARQIQAHGGRGWFLGSWSFQYYAERAGLVRVDQRALAVRAGDFVIVPYYGANSGIPQALERLSVFIANLPGPDAPLGVLTMHGAGAGFYTSMAGPLPFWRGRHPVEGILIWQVVKDP